MHHMYPPSKFTRKYHSIWDALLKKLSPSVSANFSLGIYAAGLIFYILCCPQVFAIAAHLVYWGMATIIYPLCESNVYVVAPDSSTSMYVDSIWLVTYSLSYSLVRSLERVCLRVLVLLFVRSFCYITSCSFIRSVCRLFVWPIGRSFFVRSLRSFCLSFVRWLCSFRRFFRFLIVDSFGRQFGLSIVPLSGLSITRDTNQLQ